MPTSSWIMLAAQTDAPLNQGRSSGFETPKPWPASGCGILARHKTRGMTLLDSMALVLLNYPRIPLKVPTPRRFLAPHNPRSLI
jgi:hypothetical protein